MCVCECVRVCVWACVFERERECVWLGRSIKPTLKSARTSARVSARTSTFVFTNSSTFVPTVTEAKDVSGRKAI
jgi:hypothetical protein